ncbi:MAG: lipid IV(A) 3-deoxy-D-manno-octulosonic acid transferase [Gammaproteobacteria bacterium]|nr:lipid IV(A) 3-deoxy-D-manno-octulosonic acid transferase [Gammaproteobacteria bacterium]
MWRQLYTLLYLLALPPVLIRQWLRGRREPAYRRDPLGRFGRAPRSVPGAIWIHAVSTGEVQAAAPLVRRLRQRHPRRPILMTVTTAGGRERAEALFDGEATVTWLPWDLPWTQAAFLRRTRPRALLIMETELWPNLLAACGQAGVPVMLVNARLSARSARGYGRLPGPARAMLADLHRVLCQDEATAERFRALGMAPERMEVTGSLKFDPLLPVDLAERVAGVRARLGRDRSLLVMASTHEDEEARLLAAFAPLLRRHPRWRLVLVPRHPDRFDAVWRLCRDSGVEAARWSAASIPETASLVLVDAMGVLLEICGAAELVFVGGSLVPRGGHNPVEPAIQGVPVLIGPHGFNFEAINAAFREAGALEQVADATELAERCETLLADEPERRRRGLAARQVVAARRGALEQVLDRVDALLRDWEHCPLSTSRASGPAEAPGQGARAAGNGRAALARGQCRDQPSSSPSVV